MKNVNGLSVNHQHFTEESINILQRGTLTFSDEMRMVLLQSDPVKSYRTDEWEGNGYIITRLGGAGNLFHYFQSEGEKMKRTKQEVINNLRKRLNELEAEFLLEIELRDELIYSFTPQVLILQAQPEAEEGRKPPPPTETLLDKQIVNLMNTYPGFLFEGVYTAIDWVVGYTLSKDRLVFVPHSLYSSYLSECLKSLGWSEEQEPDVSNPTYRKGLLKARQVSRWIGEEENTPEVDYPIQSNGATE